MVIVTAPMEFIGDFHFHSKYSRATSKEMNLEELDMWGQKKGITVLGTGDFTHPEWLRELKEKLEPAEEGLWKLKGGSGKTRFMLTAEISCIYSKRERVRKIHAVVFSPSFEACEKINTQLGWVGNLRADGRPILGMDAKELLKIVLDSSEECLFVPAHCLRPDTYLHMKDGIKMIKDIQEGDLVYTHKGRAKKVTKVLKRPYRGPLYTIKPFYFRMGLTTTPEHPYLILRNDRYQGSSNYYGEQLKREYFETKKPQWIEAHKVNVGDIMLFPRFNESEDRDVIQLDKALNPIAVQYRQGRIAPYGNKLNWIPNTIKVDKDFCRLVGYYLAEGFTNGRDGIGFCFSEKERAYVEEVQYLMQKVFSLSSPRMSHQEREGSTEFMYFSKVLSNAFQHLFYSDPHCAKAHTKAMPSWMVRLPLEKQVEILRGWWRGDRGYTCSRTLMNQMKIVLLRLGIVPSIRIDRKEQHEQRGKHFIGTREIFAQHDLFTMDRLSFFEDKFQLLQEPEFREFKTQTIRKNGWIDEDYIYLPVREVEKEHYKGNVYNLEVEDDNSYVTEFAAVHNCWTPWFSIFGSRSGFDSLEECFEEYTQHIYAIETGLSSSPLMNWRISALDNVTLISNSDAHSPQKTGREANVFRTELSYPGIVAAIKVKDPQKFLYTIEFFPEEGKYHFDGHRACDVSCSPEESKKYNNICPRCGKPLVIGVLNRVAELADRPEGFKPDNAIPYKSLIPLPEVIGAALGVGQASKQVDQEYHGLVKHFGNEFQALLQAPAEALQTATLPEIAEAILRVREGKVHLVPGYDGVYGKIQIFTPDERKASNQQATLF